MEIRSNLGYIAMVCGQEVERQRDPLIAVSHLLQAYDYAAQRRDRLPTMEDFLLMGKLICPDKVKGWRRVPARFGDFSFAVNPQVIPQCMSNLFDHLYRLTDTPQLDDETATAWVKELEEIHPTDDGNGRLGFIGFNWVRGKLEHPDPLPKLF